MESIALLMKTQASRQFPYLFRAQSVSNPDARSSLIHVRHRKSAQRSDDLTAHAKERISCAEERQHPFALCHAPRLRLAGKRPSDA